MLGERATTTPQEHPTEAEDGALPMTSEHLEERGPPTAGAQTLGAQLGTSHDILRRWAEQGSAAPAAHDPRPAQSG